MTAFDRLETSAKEVVVAFLLFFDVLLTVHLSIFILVINQLGAQNLFYNKFISGELENGNAEE